MTPAFLTPFRVGVVVLLGIASFFALLSFVGRRQYDESQTYRVVAIFRDASGLGAKSRVQIAGIEVGIVEKIELTEDARALATLRIVRRVVLREDAYISKRAASLLGDYVLDVYPGSPGSAPLAEGGLINRVIAQPGVDDVFATLGEVTRDIQQVTRSLSELLASEQGVGSIKEIIQSLNDLTQGLNRSIDRSANQLETILGNVERLSEDARGMFESQGDTIEKIVSNVRVFTDQANRVLDTVNSIVGSGEGELRDSVASVRDTLEKLQSSLKNIDVAVASAREAVDGTNAIIQGVSRGEGTLGQLVADDGIARQLDQALRDTNALIGTVADLQTQVHLRQEIHLGPGGGPEGKTIAQLRLMPKPDKYYGLELVSDPRGKVTRERVQRVGPDNTVISDERILTTSREFKISAYFGRRYGPVGLRLGLIESTGGGGSDLYLLRDALRFSVDAFDFANSDGRLPRLRASAQWTFLDHLYVGAGVDDALNAPLLLPGGDRLPGRGYFGTVGLEFTDDDLKALITLIGMPQAP